MGTPTSFRTRVLYVILVTTGTYSVTMTSMFFSREQPPAEAPTTQWDIASTAATQRRTLPRNKHLSDIEPSQTLKVIGIEENMEMYMREFGFDWANSTDQVWITNKPNVDTENRSVGFVNYDRHILIKTLPLSTWVFMRMKTQLKLLYRPLGAYHYIWSSERLMIHYAKILFMLYGLSNKFQRFLMDWYTTCIYDLHIQMKGFASSETMVINEYASIRN